MPFYEYECQACKFYTELMQKISDAPLVKCPSCGRRTLKKLVSAPVFRLKGGGWYETDFKSEKEGQRNLSGTEKEESKAADQAAGESKAPAPEAKDKAAKGDAKPAEKTAPPKSAAEDGGRPRPRASVARKAARAAKPKARRVAKAKGRRGRRR